MAVNGSVFMDTSVLVAGLIELDGPIAPAQRILDAVSDGRVRRALTAWPCCLEFYSVATRLPEEFRLNPEDALRLIEEVILQHFQILTLPADAFPGLLRQAASERVRGGRVYDCHIGAIAAAARAKILVTDNLAHFASLSRQGIHVVSSASFASGLL